MAGVDGSCAEAVVALQRVFLGWDRPGLQSAVEYLVGRFRGPGTLDLGNAIVVVPGGRAGRRLLELLVDRAEAERFALFPPTILTQGKLPELLYRAKRPFADELVQQLAWADVLRAAPPAQVGQIVSRLPEQADWAGWLALGEMLSRLHRELAADALDFAAVADCGSQLPGFPEAARWRTLAEIQNAYLRRLDALGLWDLQTARLVAIRQGECTTQADVILLATVDMNRAERLMLDQVADRVTALVIAPEALADWFDPYGCLRPEAWRDAPIALASEQIEVADGPADQAAAALRTVASWDGRYAGEQITLGVPDAEVIPYLEQYLGQAEVPFRYGAGKPMRRSAPCRLLEAVADYLESRRFSAWAALVRHPAVERYLDGRGLPADWLTRLDDYYQEHLPYSVGDSWMGSSDSWRGLQQAQREVEAVLGPLAGASPLGQWAEPILQLLLKMFGHRPLDPAAEPDRTTLAACSALREAFEAQQRIPPGMAPAVSGAEAIRLALRELEGAMVPALPVRGAIELLGWLELPLDDAPALIVTGFNEGVIPESLNADPFLPNRLRLALGIEDNQRRYARDAYALCVLAASRAELKLIAGRRRADNSPLWPSRLCFACDPETAARRVVNFLASKQPGAAAQGESSAPPSGSEFAARGVPFGPQPGLPRMIYEPPRPERLPERVISMRVTAFRDYLACPYRYYLRHHLGLDARGDGAEELDGAAFGSLAHDVFQAFGESELAGCTDPERLAAWLSDTLDQIVERQYGSAAWAAIRVQVEQLRLRLKAFAVWQAKRASEGWRIERVEAEPPSPGAPFVVDGEPMYLRGRIDRIDLHEPTGAIFLLDYKTSDRPRPPQQVHLSSGRWVDLQLPLYRHLAEAMNLTSTRFGLGYIAIPKDTSKVGLLEAAWTEDDLRSADEVAAEVIRQVRLEKFWPPEPAADLFDEFAAICGELQLPAMRQATAEQTEDEP